jgi:ATP-binding cassette, subfamily B, bacterial PglK
MFVLGPTRRKIPVWIASFALIAIMEAFGIGLVFPFVLSLINPHMLEQMTAIRWIRGALGFDQVNLVIGLGLAIGLLHVSKNVFSIALVHWQLNSLYKAEADIGVRLYQRYLAMPWSAISARNSSEMIRNATTSLSLSFNSVVVPSMTLLVEMMLITAIAVVLTVVDPLVAVASLGFALVSMAVYYRLVRERLNIIGHDYQQASFALLNQIKEGIGAGREIRILGRTEELVRQMAKARQTYANAVARRSFLLLVPRHYLEVILVVSVLAIVLFLIARRDSATAVPVLALFAVSAVRLLTSASRILSAVQQIKTGLPALAAVFQDMNSPLESPPARAATPEPSAHAAGIVLADVSFRYHPQGWALRDINLSVPAGGSLGIVGPSGSGKSTLVDVILGLISPQQGRIEIDGRPLGEMTGEWQRRIGYVPQSVYLTDDTLRKNVALGMAERDIDAVALQRALQQANLTSFVDGLARGIDTPIGELGAFLSGGQRQRIGIARALYHDPSVLILDEATSALDAETERAVLDAVSSLAGQKTIIIVAHRLSTVARCDHLIVLNEGRIVESGTLGELKASGTYFARSFELMPHSAASDPAKH